ncbi:MAG: RagB/SusD family nutrient uptake outer membrane protein [Bacteroidales bacterium]|nr:RagB/SusD family nutrient uptake outer membrane protein [Bacteroidales bacterium]
MKKILFYAAALSSLMLASCDEDRLEIEQKATSSTGNFYKTDADAESAATAMYATYIGEIGGNEGIWSAYLTLINYSADDIFAAGGDINDHADFRIFNEFRYDATSGCIGTLYNHIYKAIYSANLIIHYFGDNADTPAKKKAVAEARVMRAWAHMFAAQVFYQPPLVDHLITNEKPTNAESQKAIFDFCVKECEAAMADLPERQGQGDKEGTWRVTKGFAQFVAGKSALFAGDNAKAVSMLKPLVESSNYALVPGERFRDLFHVEGDGCEEKIFEFNYTTNTALGGVWGGSIQRGRWMVANVFNWRGDDIAGGGTNPRICSTGGWGGGSINQDFAHKMLENDGDSYRRKATFLTSDEFFYDEDLCGWKSDDKKDADGNVIGKLTRAEKEMDPNRGITKTAGSFSRSDVMEVKMMMHPKDADLSVGDNCNNTNLCLARLGEAYLLYAEACIASGNNAEALKYINAIQNRAGSKTVSTSVDLKVLQDEKQYEMWFEGCRYFDIVRWGIAKQCYDAVLDNIPLQFDEYWTSGQTKPHKLTYTIHHPFANAGITLKFEEGKNEYFPIPQGVLEVNDQMHQVRGWAK